MQEEGVGCIAFAPLNNGILTNRYLNGIPSDSRASRDPRYLKASDITQEKLEKVKKLNDVALNRGQTLAQLAVQWVLRKPVVTSALIGASKVEQIEENVKAISFPKLTEEEISTIEVILAGR